MFKTILVLSLACYLVVAQSADEKPDPYSFGFDETDEYGTRISRQESGDERGTITGSYSYQDAQGLTRTVNYVADDDGFRAQVDSNEPGLKSGESAGVTYNVQ